MVLPKGMEWAIGLALALCCGIAVGLSGVSVYVLMLIAVFIVAACLIKRIELFFMIFLCSLMLAPKLPMQGMNLRLEDGVAVFFAIQILMLFIKRVRFPIPNQVVKPIVVYLVYSIIVTASYILFGKLRPIYLLYWAKDVQYFFYFVAACFCGLQHSKSIETVVKSLFIANLGWGLYQLIAHHTYGYYGIGLISEKASSQSGGAFFVITLYMFYLSERSSTTRSRWGYIVLTLLGVILTLSTVSRTAVSALLVTSLILVPVYVFRNGRWAPRLYVIGWMGIATYFGYAYIDKLMGGISTLLTGRISHVQSGANTRWENWKILLSYNDTWSSQLIGKGKGFPQTITGGFTLAADSQYVRLLSEVGVIGLVMFIIIILALIKFSWANWRYAKFECMFLLMLSLGFIVMSVTHEVFAVSIQASMFWAMSGIFVAKIHTTRQGGDFVEMGCKWKGNVACHAM